MVDSVQIKIITACASTKYKSGHDHANVVVLIDFRTELELGLGLRFVYTLRLIGPISYLGACYIRTKATKCICEKMTLYFRR